MHGNETDLTNAAPRSDGSDLSSVRQAEAPIAACLSRKDPEVAVTICRQMYAQLAGSYCMAALGDVTLANRALVEIWSRLAHELESADPSRSVRSALLGLARRRCAYVLETQQAPLSSIRDASSAALVGASSLPQRARTLLARMRPSDRESLILRYVCKLSYSEVGAVWGIAEGEARTRVAQALAAATRLSESGVPSHG